MLTPYLLHSSEVAYYLCGSAAAMPADTLTCVALIAAVGMGTKTNESSKYVQIHADGVLR